MRIAGGTDDEGDTNDRVGSPLHVVSAEPSAEGTHRELAKWHRHKLKKPPIAMMRDSIASETYSWGGAGSLTADVCRASRRPRR